MSPNITGFSGYSNGVQYYSTFAQGEKDILNWNCTDNISLQNNDNGITSFGYPDITLTSYQGLYQYCSIENTATLSQTMTFTHTGSYTLSFLYCARPNYQLNNLQIYLNYKLLDIITVSQINWTQYNYTFQISTLGSYTLSFQGQGDYITETHIAISHIQLFAPTSNNIGTIAGVMVYANNFKDTIINGQLSCIDYKDPSNNIITGQFTTNYITCKYSMTVLQGIIISDPKVSYSGRIFINSNQLYFDFFNLLSFRSCSDKSFTNPINILNITNKGTDISGTLKVTGDILYNSTISISSCINTLSGLVYNSSAPVVSTISSNLISLSGVVYGTSISGKINSISGTVNSISGTVNSISGTVNSISGTVNSISGNVNSISGLVYSANNNIVTNTNNIATHTTSINLINSAATFNATTGVTIPKNLCVGNISYSSYNLDVSGNARINNGLTINSLAYSYSTLPTFTSSQVGYIVTSSLGTGPNITGSLQNLTSVSVNAGIYIVKWSYSLRAISGSTTLNYRITGVSTTSATLGSDYLYSYSADTINTTSLTPIYQGTSFLSVSSASSFIYLVVNISSVVGTGNVYLSALKIA